MYNRQNKESHKEKNKIIVQKRVKKYREKAKMVSV